MKKKLLLFLCVCLCYSACTQEKHFISDANTREVITHDFLKKQQELPQGDLFAVFQTPTLSTQEREALTFLYAYMPIGDVTDYTGAYYLENIRSAFRARQEMPWGKTIPEEIFRHFVLPVRVNNENMDESRMVFYAELKDRVKGLSLYDAVLEVNHWCHEKVIYTPSDARTSSPLASVRTAYGRCGEESTFTVAALRAVGIPARQVYTPRWAHTDDNHAWVEAWVDGQWYFLGACEPEPVLNLGWFNEPASRGMLMHTKVFGKYNGPEEVMEVTDAYTEINVIENYAPTAKSIITVTDTNGNPVEGAQVEFKIYNYAEFYSVARKKTDSTGKTFLSAGKGDMLVWATQDGKYGYRKVSFGQDHEVTITLDKTPGDAGTVSLDVVPPPVSAQLVEVTEEQRAENVRRMAAEDEIRNRYVATFYTEEKAQALAQALGTDPAQTIEYMLGSRGNWREIEAFLQTTPAEKRQTALDLLGVISAKDLRDTPAAVLSDHLNHTPPTGGELFTAYVLNPRISTELLTPYKGYFASQLGPDETLAVRNDPWLLVDWVKQNIRLKDHLNPLQIPVMPMGTWKARVADKASRDLFFIAAARSLGIPARIEPVARKIQFHAGGAWQDVDFEADIQLVHQQGKLVAAYQPVAAIDDPKYRSHFSVAKLATDGKLQTLNLRGGNRNVDMGAGNAWSGILRQPLTIDAGDYMMVTGMRMANGSVLANLSFFGVQPDQTTMIDLVMRESDDEIAVIGSFNSENRYLKADTGEEISLLQTTGRGYYIVGILGARQEPTNHALRDIAAVKGELEKWGRGMVLLFPDEQNYGRFDAHEFGALPQTITYGIDTDNRIRQEIVEQMKLSNPNALPIFIIADTFNRVVFVSQGYTIGLGEQLMHTINKL
ncbi:transglutaminase domain-containing protein [Parabacteroides sp. PF5-6]|uniref:transglutaminase domain-containing protein n=1 Tax=Parabacteroides sp. PF5-6 TaxID=1742403 RepID=UPI0024051ED0|nr:transglutaminase domain-containing protein [Parabacteroides sp. PF5-6]